MSATPPPRSLIMATTGTAPKGPGAIRRIILDGVDSWELFALELAIDDPGTYTLGMWRRTPKREMDLIKLEGYTNIEAIDAVRKLLPLPEWLHINQFFMKPGTYVTATLVTDRMFVLDFLEEDCMKMEIGYETPEICREHLDRIQLIIEQMNSIHRYKQIGATVFYTLPEVRDVTGVKHICFHCTRLSMEELAKCSACLQATYCDAECQRKDWKRHRATCHRVCTPVQEAMGLALVASSAEAARMKREREKEAEEEAEEVWVD